MYDQILFPTDGSAPTAAVLEYALDIAAEHDGAIHVISVVDTTSDGLAPAQPEMLEAQERAGQRIVDEAAAQARDRDVPVTTAVLQGTPHERIVEYSARSDVDCIVMPTHGRRGLQRYLLGSVTERVINTASVPVLSVNPERDRALTYPCRHLLVPTDGSRGAERAVTEGVAVAAATGATLHLLHVVETGSLGPDARARLPEGETPERANDVIAAAAELADSMSLDSYTTTIEYGEPVRAIHSYLEANPIDLAVLGTQGETDFSRYVMGGVSAKIVRTAPVPVLWVREPESADDT